MMRKKIAPLTVCITALAFSVAGCSTAVNVRSEEPMVGADDLHCALPTNCVSSLGSASERPLAFVGTSAEGLAHLRRTLQYFPEASVQGATETTLTAIFTTTVGFKDIVEFRVDATARRIDFRSRSGLGLFDFGKNRSRMREFAARFTQSAGH